MTAAAVALVALIGWLFGLQILRVGRDLNARPSRAVLVTTAVLGGGAALLVIAQRHGGGHGPGQDPGLTAVALVTLIGWLTGLQTLRVGRDLNARPPRAVRVTTAVLGAAAVLLAVPDLYLMVT
jgi:xanthosine utilization system XapX-like protein